jgi:transcription factor IIIB subunit 2
MQNLSAQLEIPENTVNQGHNIFKLCAMHNFIQGRRMEMVVAVCLYTACRTVKPCRVMLIDFADKLQVSCLTNILILLPISLGQCV